MSPPLLVAQLLACKIRQEKEIQGINIFVKELKLNQFADDTTLLNSNCSLVNKAIAVLDNFWPEIEPVENGSSVAGIVET